jgi:hypothetical protein
MEAPWKHSRYYPQEILTSQKTIGLRPVIIVQQFIMIVNPLSGRNKDLSIRQIEKLSQEVGKEQLDRITAKSRADF